MRRDQIGTPRPEYRQHRKTQWAICNAKLTGTAPTATRVPGALQERTGTAANGSRTSASREGAALNIACRVEGRRLEAVTLEEDCCDAISYPDGSDHPLIGEHFELSPWLRVMTRRPANQIGDSARLQASCLASLLADSCRPLVTVSNTCSGNPFGRIRPSSSITAGTRSMASRMRSPMSIPRPKR